MFEEEHKKVLLTVIVSGVLLSLFLVTVFILSVIRYKRRIAEDLKEKLAMKKSFEQALLQSQIEVQESTLSTLSKDLHDNIGQLLSTVKVLLGITERNLTSPPDTLLTANATVGQAINELRSLSKSLDKEWLEQFNLIENLSNEVNRLNSVDSVKLKLHNEKKVMLQADKQIILFRIVQEAIQNALKHASAKNILISVEILNDILVTSVKDDGKGFEKYLKPDGVGIINMKHRAKLLGGSIEWCNSNPGCEVVITLPVKPDEI